MNGFYETISELYPDYSNMVATMLEGDFFGEKAIFSNGSMVYESKEGTFTEDIQKKILNNYGSGMIQMDNQRIFTDTLASEKKLVICGGGHIAIPIVQIGKMLGFHVTVIEDRIQFADNVRRTNADEVICDDFLKALERIKGDGDTYFVIVTRGHRYDQVCLEEIIKKESAYIGMIGSKLRVKKVKELLIEKGVDSVRLERVYTPIGLRIGAETPEEISISIMAEIIEVKNQVKKSGGYPKDIKKAIMDEESKGIPKILATIVSRKGSAPREVGTKMLFYKDGMTVGTIGGGCVEADISRDAHYQLMQGDLKPKIYTVDMTGRDAEDEGMVCGGVVEILLETII